MSFKRFKSDRLLARILHKFGLKVSNGGSGIPGPNHPRSIKPTIHNPLARNHPHGKFNFNLLRKKTDLRTMNTPPMIVIRMNARTNTDLPHCTWVKHPHKLEMI